LRLLPGQSDYNRRMFNLVGLPAAPIGVKHHPQMQADVDFVPTLFVRHHSCIGCGCCDIVYLSPPRIVHVRHVVVRMHRGPNTHAPRHQHYYYRGSYSFVPS
jgi:hypothetical protein